MLNNDTYEDVAISVSVADADTTDYIVLGLPVWKVRKTIDREGEVDILQYYFLGFPVYKKCRKCFKSDNRDIS